MHGGGDTAIGGSHGAAKGGFKDSALSGTIDGNKASLGGGSAALTYSTIANVPKAKRQKLIAEAKPMVRNVNCLSISIAWWCKKVQRHLVGNQKG